MTEGSQDAIGLCLAGEISPQVAIARLLLGGKTAEQLTEMVAERRPGADAARWRALSGLLEGRAGTLNALAAEIAAVGSDHSRLAGQGGIAGVAAFFDHLVTRSPEASVALYSLADPAILAAATAEIVRWMERADLIGGTRDMLDLGCGIGRMSAALAPHCRSVLGLDVSAGMVAEARRRCAGLANARFEATSGENLDALPSQGFDLVLAVDSFPYIVQAGPDLVARHIEGAVRVLRPGGVLVILNLSYRQDLAADRVDAADWSTRYGFTLEQSGERPFELWDGTAFVLRRPG